jgi:hypothetical protein
MRRAVLFRITGVSLIAVGPLACSGSDADPGEMTTQANGGSSASSSKVAGGSSIGGSQALGGSKSTGGSVAGGSQSLAASKASGGSGIASSEVPAGGKTTAGGSEAGGVTASSSKARGGSGAGGAQAGGSSTGAGGRQSAGGAANGGTSNSKVSSVAKAGSAPVSPSSGGAKAGGAAGTAAATGGKNTGGSSSNGGNATAAGSSNVSMGADGCSDSLALGINISELAVFQSGKISIMKSGAAVTATTEQGAAVIQGRDAMFRIYVTTDSGFQSRQLSARLTLNGGTTPYYAKQTISGSSSELSTTNSFQISVPASEMTSSLSYSVKVVECGTGAGTAHSPVFPASGTATIATRATGVIKITLVPVSTKNTAPDLTALSTSLPAHIEAQYPTTKAQITVSSTPITGCGIAASTAIDTTTWDDCLTSVRNRRTSDKPASDVYYVGVVIPTTTYAQYCGNACVAGVGYVATSANMATARALIAVGFPDALDSITHELGHNHGLEHSPGCGADQADASFPYIVKGVAHIGWVGWSRENPTKFLDPASYTDLMAYCDPVWVSDYIYAKFATRIAALNGVSALWKGTEAASTWRVLDVINGNAKWGVPLTDPVPAFGEPESGTVYDANGNSLLEVTVYRTNSSSSKSAMYLVPEPSVDWATLQIGSTTVAFQ